jgi:hypothetical protein
MPHFMALAWMCKDDYARGGFRMLSMIDPSGRRTAGVALRHCAYLLPVGAAAAALGVTSWWFAGEAAALAAVMGAGAASFAAAPSQATARRLFRGSLLYLPVLLVALAVHRRPHAQQLSSWADVRQRVESEFGVRLALPGVAGLGALGGEQPAAEQRGAATEFMGVARQQLAAAWAALPSLPQVRACLRRTCVGHGWGGTQAVAQPKLARPLDQLCRTACMHHPALSSKQPTAACKHTLRTLQVRLRSAQERLAPFLPELQRIREQLGRCPSRVYGDSIEQEGPEAGLAAGRACSMELARKGASPGQGTSPE